METGTGKTYVYLRTIFELNHRYGFTKFAHRGAVGGHQGRGQQVAGHHGTAPSRAVFGHAVRALRVRLHEAVTGSELRHQPASADHGGDRRRHQQARRQQHLPAEREDRRREKPIDLVRATSPVLIVDEPQSVDGGLKGQGRKALEMMNPLCTLRYSATHADNCSFHGLSARCGGRLRTQAGEADRGSRWSGPRTTTTGPMSAWWPRAGNGGSSGPKSRWTWRRRAAACAAAP